MRKTKNLCNARRFRNSIASQIQRQNMVEGQDPVYLRRLEMAKRVLDQKIEKLRRLIRWRQSEGPKEKHKAA
jgi:sorting nexin-25